MANWLVAKDQRQHCCPTCCLGFKTDTELFVHLKHTKVHKGTTEAQQAAALLLPKDEARLLRRNLHGSSPAHAPTTLGKSQQRGPEVQQPPSGQHSSLGATLNRALLVKSVLKHAPESVPQGRGSEHSLASARKESLLAIHHGRVGQAAADDTQEGSGCPEECVLESQHDANDGANEPAAMQDCPVHVDAQAPNARQASIAESSTEAAPACTRFHADSLKSLKRRIVAKKRKRKSVAPGVTDDYDSAASSCEVATMTFIEPHLQQAATVAGDGLPKRQC